MRCRKGGPRTRFTTSSRSTHHVKPSAESRLAPGNMRSGRGVGPGRVTSSGPQEVLAQEQLGLARQALEVFDEMHKNAQVKPDDPMIAVWERRQVEAVRDAGASRAEFIAALEGYVKRMRVRQQIVEAHHQAAQVAFADVLDAKYRVLEAEMWLNQEKAR